MTFVNTEEADMWETCSVGSVNTAMTNNAISITNLTRPLSPKRVIHWKHKLCENPENEVELNAHVNKVLNGLTNLLYGNRLAESSERIQTSDTYTVNDNISELGGNNNKNNNNNLQSKSAYKAQSTFNEPCERVKNTTTTTNNELRKELAEMQKLLRRLDSERRHFRGYALRQQSELELIRKERAMLKEHLHESHHTLVALRKEHDTNKRRIRLLLTDKDQMTEEMMELRRFIRSIEPSLRAQTLYIANSNGDNKSSSTNNNYVDNSNITNSNEGGSHTATQICEEALELVPDRRFEEAFRDKMEVISSKRKCSNARMLFERTRETIERWQMESEDAAERSAIAWLTERGAANESSVSLSWITSPQFNSRERVIGIDNNNSNNKNDSNNTNYCDNRERSFNTENKQQMLHHLLQHRVHFNTHLLHTDAFISESPSLTSVLTQDEKAVRWAMQKTKFLTPMQRIKSAVTVAVNKMSELCNHELQQLLALYLQTIQSGNLPEVLMSYTAQGSKNVAVHRTSGSHSQLIKSDKQRCFEKYINQIRRKTCELAAALSKNVNEALTHIVEIENETYSSLETEVRLLTEGKLQKSNHTNAREDHDNTYSLNKLPICSSVHEMKPNKKYVTSTLSDNSVSTKNANSNYPNNGENNYNNIIDVVAAAESETNQCDNNTKHTCQKNEVEQLSFVPNAIQIVKHSTAGNNVLPLLEQEDVTCNNENVYATLARNALLHLATLEEAIYKSVKDSLEQRGQHSVAEKLCDPLQSVLAMCIKVNDRNVTPNSSKFVNAATNDINNNNNGRQELSEHLSLSASLPSFQSNVLELSELLFATTPSNRLHHHINNDHDDDDDDTTTNNNNINQGNNCTSSSFSCNQLDDVEAREFVEATHKEERTDEPTSSTSQLALPSANTAVMVRETADEVLEKLQHATKKHKIVNGAETNATNLSDRNNNVSELSNSRNAKNNTVIHREQQPTQLSEALTQATRVTVSYLNYLLSGKNETLEPCMVQETIQEENNNDDDSNNNNNNNNNTNNNEHHHYSGKKDVFNNTVEPSEYTHSNNKLSSKSSIAALLFKEQISHFPRNIHEETLLKENDMSGAKHGEHNSSYDNGTNTFHHLLHESREQTSDNTNINALETIPRNRRHTMPELTEKGSSTVMTNSMQNNLLPSSTVYRKAKPLSSRRKSNINTAKVLPTSIIRLPQAPISNKYEVYGENGTSQKYYSRENYMNATEFVPDRAQSNTTYYTMPKEAEQQSNLVYQRESKNQFELSSLQDMARMLATPQNNYTNNAKLKLRPMRIANSLHTCVATKHKQYDFDGNVCKTNKESPSIALINMQLHSESNLL